MRRSPSSKRKLALWLLSLIVVVSMLCSLVVMIRPLPPARTPQLTAIPLPSTFTPAPTLAPTHRALTAAPPTKRLEAIATITPTATVTPT